MANGLRDASGNRVGKTIIFAQNKNHAQFIVDRFNALYPEFKGTFCRRVVCDDDYVQDLILQFKDPVKEPYIAVSVDMLDTGIDVPRSSTRSSLNGSVRRLLCDDRRGPEPVRTYSVRPQ